MHTSITKMPRCRWCDKEPEFTPTRAEENVCEHCSAMQQPVLNLKSPAAQLILSLFVNPDDSVFFEVTKKEGSTRYILSPERLKQAGAFVKTPVPLNGKKLDSGL